MSLSLFRPLDCFGRWSNGQPGRVSNVQSPREAHTCSLREEGWCTEERELQSAWIIHSGEFASPPISMPFRHTVNHNADANSRCTGLSANDASGSGRLPPSLYLVHCSISSNFSNQLPRDQSLWSLRRCPRDSAYPIILLMLTHRIAYSVKTNYLLLRSTSLPLSLLGFSFSGKVSCIISNA